MAEERLSRSRFLRLGAALGVGAASASVVAACGGGGSGGGEYGAQGGATQADATQAGGATQGGETTGSGEPEAAGNQPGGETADVAGSGGTTATEVRGGTAIVREAAVAPGSAVEFTDTESGQPAVLVHLQDGDFAAYSAVCTHQGCTVAYQNGNLACPCHGSVFDPANGGAVVSPPANRPLPEIPVEVRDGGVFRA
ncbi:MAG: Rieske (2Fe-2S) protein [Actinomycetota bacterium]|nr:Rieske (2Fe-2S) protein [Actinomycetota bacterium]